jgi:hypothetical protein
MQAVASNSVLNKVFNVVVVMVVSSYKLMIDVFLEQGRQERCVIWISPFMQGVVVSFKQVITKNEGKAFPCRVFRQSGRPDCSGRQQVLVKFAGR